MLENAWAKVRKGSTTLICCLVLFANFAQFALAADGDALRPQMNLLPPTDQTTTAGSSPASATDASNAPPESYVLGRGDSLKVIDYSGRDLHNMLSTQIVKIQPDGTASVYPVGVVYAAGKTIQQLNDLVNDSAKKYVIEPQFQVSLFQARPVVVYVLGEVLNPGVYTIGSGPQQQQGQPTMEVSSQVKGYGQGVPIMADTSAPSNESAPVPDVCTVLAALQKAGGLRETANVRYVKITRPRTNQTFHVDVWKLLVEGDASQDITLEAQDTVFVPPAGTRYDPVALGRLAANHRREVRIWGAVKQPGLYDLGPHDDILSVIAKAGGFTHTAKTGSVLLSRANLDGTISKGRISVKDALALPTEGRKPIQPGDVVVVASSAFKEARGPALKGLGTVALAYLLLFLNSRLQNVNTTSNNNNNTRVVVF